MNWQNNNNNFNWQNNNNLNWQKDNNLNWQKDNNNQFIEINNKLDQIKNQLDILKYKESTYHIIHQGIKCQNCNKTNIMGIRFKCLKCADFDVCQDCERYLSLFHDNSHFFMRIHDTTLYNNIINNSN